MQIMKPFWFAGYMPIQLLLLVSLLFLTFVASHSVLKRMGKSIPVISQVMLIGLTAYSALKYVIYPPIPSSLLYTYMGLITLVVFLLVSSTEKSWKEFKEPLFATLGGETRKYRLIRSVAFTIIPLLAFVITYNLLRSDYETPPEIIIAHPAPPRSITVHGITYDLQTARNPFRVQD